MREGTRSSRKDQSVLEGRQELLDGMAKEGFTPGTQKAYEYAYGRFVKALKGKSVLAANVSEAKRYLAELKRSGASRNVYGTASAVLRFLFVKVRGVEWSITLPHSPCQMVSVVLSDLTRANCWIC